MRRRSPFLSTNPSATGSKRERIPCACETAQSPGLLLLGAAQTGFRGRAPQRGKKTGPHRLRHNHRPLRHPVKIRGVFFYGIHQIDQLVRLLDDPVTHVRVNLGKKNHAATLFSAGGAISTANFISDVRPPFHVSIIGEKGRIDRQIVRDAHPHLIGTRTFCRMFKTGKTDETEQSMLTPIAVLEALEKSIKTGKKVKVPSI